MMAQLLALADDLIDGCARENVLLRLLGSAAVAHLVPLPLIPGRTPRDLDFVCRAENVLVAGRVFELAGFKEDKAITRLFGENRRRFRAEAGGSIDLCLDKLVYCRTIDLRDRLAIRDKTIAVSDLLLSKFQMRELTDWDIIAICELLSAFRPAAQETVAEFDVGRIASVCSRDWGLHRLVLASIQAVSAVVSVDSRLAEARFAIIERLSLIRDAIGSQPKSFAWKVRGLLGDKLQYWNDVDAEAYLGPDDVEQGH